MEKLTDDMILAALPGDVEQVRSRILDASEDRAAALPHLKGAALKARLEAMSKAGAISKRAGRVPHSGCISHARRAGGFMAVAIYSKA